MSGYTVIQGAAVASLVGAVFALDRTAAVQSMTSRPIVTAPVVGYLLGCPVAGLLAGVALELVFIGDLPVGGHVPVHETGLAVLVAALSSVFIEAHGFGQYDLAAALSAVTAAVLVGVPVSVLYRLADERVRAYNSRFHRRAEAAVAEGRGGLMIENLKGAAAFFAASAGTFFFTLLPLMYGASLLPEGLSDAVAYSVYPAYAALLVLGAAAVFNLAGGGRLYALFAAFGSAAALLLAFLL